MDGSIRLEIEAGSGLFLVICRGMWSPEAAIIHFADMELALRKARAAGRPVRVLIDIRDSRPQTAETARTMEENARRLHLPSDRLAFVYSSALQGLQAKRAVSAAPTAYFDTMEAARRWLAEEPER